MGFAVACLEGLTRGSIRASDGSTGGMAKGPLRRRRLRHRRRPHPRLDLRQPCVRGRVPVLALVPVRVLSRAAGPVRLACRRVSDRVGHVGLMWDLTERNPQCRPRPDIHRPLEALLDRLTEGLGARVPYQIGELLLSPPLPALRKFGRLCLARSSVVVANLGEQVAGPKAGPSPEGARIFQRPFCRPEPRERHEREPVRLKSHCRENPDHVDFVR